MSNTMFCHTLPSKVLPRLNINYQDSTYGNNVLHVGRIPKPNSTLCPLPFTFFPSILAESEFHSLTKCERIPNSNKAGIVNLGSV